MIRETRRFVEHAARYVVAGINLYIFAPLAGRVRMTAIARMVNVFQALIVTDGSRMKGAPTCRVSHMHKPYIDAPDAVPPVAFAGARLEGGTLSVTLAARSVVMLDLR